MAQEHIESLPQSFDSYLDFVTRLLEDNQRNGGVAIKFEIAYFRPLNFDDPPRAAANEIYQKYKKQGVPTWSD